MTIVSYSNMNSIGKSCNEIKKQYDDCFQVWFSEKFLNGETDESCSSLYKMYQHCLQLKEEYDACFNIWFSQKFLKGDNNDSMCAQLLKVYKQCVEKSMKDNHIELKDVDIQVLGTDKEARAPDKK